ncbi:hypothetical protein GA0115240_10331, partial [Streptomyces sp. DvalAA-14]
MAGDVADGDRQPGRRPGGAFLPRQEEGVVPVAADHVRAGGRAVQRGQVQAGNGGQGGEHGVLELVGDVDPLVEEQGALHRLGGVAGDRGENGGFGHVDVMRCVPAQDQHAQRAPGAQQRQAGRRTQLQGVERGHGLRSVVLRQMPAVRNGDQAPLPQGACGGESGAGLQVLVQDLRAVRGLLIQQAVQAALPVRQQQPHVGRFEVPADHVPHAEADLVQARGVRQILRRPQQQLGAGQGPAGAGRQLVGAAAQRAGVGGGDPQPQLRRTGCRQVPQVLQLTRCPVAGRGVDRTQRTQHMAEVVGQRDTRVTHHPEIGDRHAVPRQLGFPGVADHQRITGDDHVPAQRVRQGRLPSRRPRIAQAHHAREDLPVLLHQRHQRHRHIDDPRHQPCEPLHVRVRRGRQTRLPQRQQPRRPRQRGRAVHVVRSHRHRLRPWTHRTSRRSTPDRNAPVPLPPNAAMVPPPARRSGAPWGGRAVPPCAGSTARMYRRADAEGHSPAARPAGSRARVRCGIPR